MSQAKRKTAKHDRQRNGVPLPPPAISDAVAAAILNAFQVAREHGILPQIGMETNKGSVGPGRRGRPLSTAASRVQGQRTRLKPLSAGIVPQIPGEVSPTRDWERASQLDVKRPDPYEDKLLPTTINVNAGYGPNPYPNPYDSTAGADNRRMTKWRKP